MSDTVRCHACCRDVEPLYHKQIVGCHQSRRTAEPYFYKYIRMCPCCGEKNI